MWETALSLGAGQTVPGVLEHRSLSKSPSRNDRRHLSKARQTLQASTGGGCAGGCSLMEDAERIRKSIFTVPRSFGQGTCLWFCLLGFYFALFGNLVVHVELLVHSSPPEILSVQPPECSHSYMPLCSASWLCFQGRKGLWVLCCPHPLYIREGVSN